MTPLTLFKSATFSGVNALTFVLYAALGAPCSCCRSS